MEKQGPVENRGPERWGGMGLKQIAEGIYTELQKVGSLGGWFCGRKCSQSGRVGKRNSLVTGDNPNWGGEGQEKYFSWQSQSTEKRGGKTEATGGKEHMEGSRGDGKEQGEGAKKVIRGTGRIGFIF